MATPPALDPATVAERTGSGYPEPLRAPCVARSKRALGSELGLTHFGVNLTRLDPGAWSAQRHWHGHHLINRTTRPALYLEVGDRTPGDEVHYPDVDLFVAADFSFRHKSGEPY